MVILYCHVRFIHHYHCIHPVLYLPFAASVDLEQHLSNIKLRFFTDISHELRTPLTLISSPVSEILAHEAISPTVREHLNLVHKNTERMLRLVNQLLDFRKTKIRR